MVARCWTTYRRAPNDHGRYVHRIEVQDPSSELPTDDVRPPGHDPTSPTGAWRITTGDNEVRLWDLIHDLPGPVTRVDPGQYSQVYGAIWVADDSFVVYGSFGLQRYDIHNSGK